LYQVDKGDVYNFFVEPGQDPSLSIEQACKPDDFGFLSENLKNRTSFANDKSFQFYLHQDFFLETQRSKTVKEFLYLASIQNYEKLFSPQYSLMTMPEILKGMEKNKKRLDYLKAWQFLMGAHKTKLEAYEVRKKT
tara:strand:- start:651 stop:1058 length:408 start_codon:yes stop_codon:yes gene_type:complete